MNKGAKQLIHNLTPEIERKCEQIKLAKKEKLQTRLFLLLCLLVVIVPIALVIFGISLSVFIIPIIFMCLSVVMLLPILLGQQGGKNYEKV